MTSSRSEVGSRSLLQPNPRGPKNSWTVAPWRCASVVDLRAQRSCLLAVRAKNHVNRSRHAASSSIARSGVMPIPEATYTTPGRVRAAEVNTPSGPSNSTRVPTGTCASAVEPSPEGLTVIRSVFARRARQREGVRLAPVTLREETPQHELAGPCADPREVASRHQDARRAVRIHGDVCHLNRWRRRHVSTGRATRKLSQQPNVITYSASQNHHAAPFDRKVEPSMNWCGITSAIARYTNK